IELPTWSDFSPRLSVVYDLSGNGKTAVRAGFNKFVTAQTTGFAQLYNPTALTTQQLPWEDLNTDDIAQGERGCVFRSAGCEINFAALPTNFGVRSLAQFDAELARPYELSFNAGITHEIFPGVTVSAEYVHSAFRNITVRQNSLRDANSYDKFDVVSPLDGKVIPAWVVKPAFSAAVLNVDSTSPDMKRWFNAVELGYSARMAKGLRAFGGFGFAGTLN